ncbi:MAG: cytochrome b/b6 domain-containing protein [Rhodoferax sp.]
MQRILIWDWPTRVFHWCLASSFALAWLTSEGDRWRSVHVFLGYLMLGLIAFRLIWGFVGTHHARFRNFWFSPREGLDYLKQVLAGRAARHVGHNPAGSVAIYALLALATLIGITGILTLGGEEQQGLAAGWLSFAQGRMLKEVHEASAVAMLVLVAGHIAGVVVESLLHRENLARAMVNGYKMADRGTPEAKPHRLLAALMGLAMLSFGAVWFDYLLVRGLDAPSWSMAREAGGAQKKPVKFTGRPLPDNPTWREECSSCHGVFYPALLPARSWRAIMAQQDQHFGTDLGLDAATTQAVLDFMVANAAEHHQVEAAFKIDRSIPADQTPLRITETAYWIKKHRDIDPADWANPAVKSKVNCSACHSDADQGWFEDAAMHIPARPSGRALSAASARPTQAN